MPGAVYRAEFLLTETKEKNPHTELSETKTSDDKKATVDEIVEKKKERNTEIASSAKKAVGVGLAIGAFAYNYSVNEQLTSYAIQGDSIATRNLQNQRTITNELLSSGGALLTGAIIGGPVGLATAGVGLGIKYAMKAIDYSNQVQIYNANVQIEQYLSNKEQNKIAENVRGFR